MREATPKTWVEAKRGQNLIADKAMDFGLHVVKLYAQLSKSAEAQVMGRQLLRSGTSAGAQNSEACRARSDAEFISKIEGSLQELEESSYWLRMMGRAGCAPDQQLEQGYNLAEELIRLMVASVKTVKARNSAHASKTGKR